MSTIEVVSILLRFVAVGATLAIIGWLTSRRVAARPVDTADPIRQHLDRTGRTS